MYLEHAWISPHGVRSHHLMHMPVKLSNLVTQEVRVNSIEGPDNIDGVQRHLGWIVGCKKLTGSC